MLKFLWAHAPQRLKYLVMGLALLAGMSRDWVMMVVNKAAAASVNETISYWLPMFVLTFVTVLVAGFFYQILTTVVTTHVVNNVRLKLIGGLLKAQPSFIDRREHGAIYHILTTDVSAVAGFTSTVLNLLPALIFLCIAIPQVFIYSAVAGLFVLLVMVGGSLAYHLQQKTMAKLNDDARGLEVAYFERVSEMLRGFRELRLHQGRKLSFSQDLGNVLERLRTLLIKVNRIYETGESAVQGLKFLLFAGIVFLVPYLIKTDSVVTFQVLTLVLFSLTPFEQIVTSYPSVIGTLVSFLRIRDLANELEEIERVADLPSAYKLEGKAPAFDKITLRGIETRYASRETSSFALGPVDFEIKRGDVVFLLGRNGSGKTTFMNVLAGLLEPTAGEIELDGKRLAPEDMDAYRANFSAIFTQFHVFRKLYGLEGIDPAAADEVIEKVHLTGITKIRDDGISRIDLSAGQRRRLALAIALLEDRNFLVLDEFVADQDPENRNYFFRTLVPWLKQQGKTIVVSTHDLAWMDCCDRAFKFENGKMSVQPIPPVKPNAPAGAPAQAQGAAAAAKPASPATAAKPAQPQAPAASHAPAAKPATAAAGQPAKDGAVAAAKPAAPPAQPQAPAASPAPAAKPATAAAGQPAKDGAAATATPAAPPAQPQAPSASPAPAAKPAAAAAGQPAKDGAAATATPAAPPAQPQAPAASPAPTAKPAAAAAGQPAKDEAASTAKPATPPAQPQVPAAGE